MSFHLFFINGWGFESNFWKPTCDLLILKDIVSSAKILDKNCLKNNAPKKVPINTIFITHSMGLNFFLEMKVDCIGLINFFSAPDFLGFQKNFEKFNSLVTKKHTIKYIPDASHAYPLNQPNQTAKLIYDFIQSLS